MKLLSILFLYALFCSFTPKAFTEVNKPDRQDVKGSEETNQTSSGKKQSQKSPEASQSYRTKKRMS